MKTVPLDNKTAYCTNCSKMVTFHFNKVNHWTSALLTVLTCGLWLPIWVTTMLAPTKVCDHCHEAIWVRD